MAKLYDTLSDAERDTLRKLQAKAKRVQRQDKAFWQWVDDHADEVKSHLGIYGASESSGGDWWNEYQEASKERDELRQDMDKLQLVADEYGCSLQELFDWIQRSDCIEYYRRKQRTVAVEPTDSE